MRRRKALEVVPGDTPSGLGLETIMDRGLAARFGVPYVHLAVFAIDLDRINAEAGDDDVWPTGWEVFLTELYLLDRFDPANDEHRELVADTCSTVMDAGQALGAQIPFAVWDAVARRAWPRDLERLFRSWKKKPEALARALADLHADPDAPRRLAERALALSLDPSLAAPTREALEALARA
jgi:hypothetical protein